MLNTDTKNNIFEGNISLEPAYLLKNMGTVKSFSFKHFICRRY